MKRLKIRLDSIIKFVSWSSKFGSEYQWFFLPAFFIMFLVTWYSGEKWLMIFVIPLLWFSWFSLFDPDDYEDNR